ncbi:MAG: hypothetical protein LBS59_05410, partial [Puniceicoccales bacterium]|nr:hypothetical protein [Puniceicoccales bacterium]
MPFFEENEGFSLGAIPANYPAEVSPASQVSVFEEADGNKILKLAAPVSGSGDEIAASVVFDLAGVLSGGGNVLWAETKLRVPAQTFSVGAQPAAVFNLDGAFVSFVQTAAGVGRFIVYDGKLGLTADGVPVGGEWKTVGENVPLEGTTNLATTLATVTVRADYQRKKFDLWLNGNLVAVNLGFADSSVSSPVVFSFFGALSGDSFFDDVFLSTSAPASVPFSTVGDGIPDTWKTQNDLSTTDTLLRDQTDSTTNLSLIEKFFYGLPAVGDGFSELLGAMELPRGFLREVWSSIAGLQVSQLRSATAHFRTEPVIRSLTNGAEAPQNIANQYGQRLRGYITIPVSGDYRFYLTADDRAELYISPTTSKFQKQLVAQVAPLHAGVNEWTKYADQRSEILSLTAGQKIYVEILHKEDGGGDHARLGWTTPLSQTIALVPATVLTSFVYDPNDADDDDLPDDWETQNNLSTSDNGSTNPANGADGVNNTLGIPNYIAAFHNVSATSPPATLPDNTAYKGVFSREVFTNIAGATTASLKGSASFLSPAGVSGFVLPSGSASIDNDTGERWRGYITVPVTGNYSFGIHSSGAAEFYLSADSSAKNKRPIALVRESTSAYQFRFSEQKSIPVTLVADQQYYVEILFKQGTAAVPLFQLSYDPHITGNYVPLPPELVSSFLTDPATDRVGFSLDYLVQNSLSPNTLFPGNYFATGSYFDNWNAYKLNIAPAATANELNVLFSDPDSEHRGLTHETWFSAAGALADNLNKFLTTPDRREIIANGDDFPSQLADAYITRTRGYIVAPVTGNYYFAVNGDDETEVFLSTSDAIAYATRIINAPCTAWNVWNNAAQKSAAIPLVAGQKYYIEIRHREVSGNDFLRLAWQLPDTATLAIIPSAALRPFAPSSADPYGFGYPDSWFTNAGFTTLSLQQRAPWADPFASGLNNWQNYALGLDPLGVSGTGPYTNIYGHLELPGRLLHETWANISGGSPFALRRLTNDFRDTPSSVSFWYGADREISVADNYGQRLRGYITIPQTGTYNFYISGDQNAEFYIGTNGTKWNKTRAAFTTGATDVRQWTKNASQKSAPYNFVAGQKVYIEIQHKETSGWEYFSLGWTTPGNSAIAVVPANLLSSFVYDSNDADDDDLPDDWESAHGLSTADNGGTDPLNGKHGIRNNVGLKNYQCAALNLDPNDPAATPLFYTTEIPGVFLREKWQNVAGDSISTFTKSATATPANALQTFTAAATNTTTEQDTAERWRGYITAPYTGNYALGIQANTTAELYLSNDAAPVNKRHLATLRAASSNFSYPEQKTLTISLVAGQRYYVEALFKKGASGDAFGRLLWTTPLNGDFQIVPDEVISSWSKGTTLDSAGLPLTWLAQNNLQPDTLSPNATAANGYLPYFAAAKLNIAPATASSLQNPISGGLTYDLWHNATGTTLADNLALFLTTPNKREIVTGGDSFPQQLGDNFIARVRGYIVAPTTGYYRFAINNDDEAELYLSTDAQIVNAKKRIEAPCLTFDQWTSASQQSSPVFLQANQRYFIEIRHHEIGGSDFLRLAWQTPNNDYLEFVPATALQAFIPDATDPYGLGYPQSWLEATGLSNLTLEEQMPWADPNNDGLTNLEKYTRGLNPLSSDSDNDGISDYEEIKQLGTDPLAADFDGTVNTLLTLDGSAYTSATGNWQTEDNTVHAVDTRGALVYTINLTEGGIFRLVLTGGQYLTTSPEKTLYFDLYTNNTHTGSLRLDATQNNTGTATAWLPYLTAGTHTIRLVWLNGVSGSSARIDQLKIEQRGGTWLASLQSNISFVDPA